MTTNQPVTLEGVKAVWGDVVRDVKPHNPNLQALLRHIYPIALEDNTIVLKADFKFHKEKIEQAQPRRLLEDLISKHLGQHLAIACTLENYLDDQDYTKPASIIVDVDTTASLQPQAQQQLSTLERVESIWIDVVRDVKPHNPNLQALLRNVRPIAVQNQVVLLKTDFKFHKEKIEQTQSRQLLEGLISSRMGQPFSIACTMEDRPDEKELREVIRKSRKDPYVKAAINVFDADVIGMEVEPTPGLTRSVEQEELKTIDFAQDIIAKQGFPELADKLSTMMQRIEAHLEAFTIEAPDESGLNTGVVGFVPGAEVFDHDRLLFRTRSEIAIYDELKKRDVLFFPNTAAIMGGKGLRKEPDFLICQKGKWGILEVSGLYGHPISSAVKDHERERLFGDYGVTCFEHYSAKKCYDDPKWVVDDFLKRLKEW